MRVHVDEAGNIRKGPPLPMPLVLDGAYALSTRSSYVNEIGPESMFPPPISGRATFNLLREDELYSATHTAEPVENGLHHGHVLNDPNGELDRNELAGVNQVPATAMLNMAYDPFLNDGMNNLFTTQGPPPPGVSEGGPGLPRAPGGGVTTREAILAAGGAGGSEAARRRGGAAGSMSTAFDVARESRRAESNGVGFGGSAGGVTRDLGRAARMAAVDSAFTPIEMTSAQAQRVLNGSSTTTTSSSYAKHRDAIVGHGRRFPVHRERRHPQYSYYVDKYGRRRKRRNRHAAYEHKRKCAECRQEPNRVCHGCG